MAYTLDATFTVDGNPVTGVCATSYSTLVELELQSTGGVNTIAWSFVGQSNSGYTAPTITPAGSPSGQTASFTMIADPSTGLGATFLLQCVVTDSNGATDTKRALISVANDLIRYPLASDEKRERDATYGYIDLLNVLMAGGGTFTAPTGGENYQVCYGLSSTSNWAAGVTIPSGSSETGLAATGFLAVGSSYSGTGSFRGGTAVSLYGYTGADHPLLRLSSGALTIGDDTYTAGITYSTKTATTHTFESGNNKIFAVLTDSVAIYNPSDATDAVALSMDGTNTYLAQVFNSGTAQILVQGISGTAYLGEVTNIATAAVRASTTINATVGANNAWSATASAQTWKIGANTCATLGAANAIWGDSTNVTTTSIKATTTVNAYLGANAVMWLNATNSIFGSTTAIATTSIGSTTTLKGTVGSNDVWTATATQHTFAIGANECARFSADVFRLTKDGTATRYTTQTQNAGAWVLATVSGGASNTVLTADTTSVYLADSTNTDTLALRSSTTINATVGANNAWSATATAQNWKIGATTYLTLNGTYFNSDLPVRLKEGTAPGTPASGYAYLYMDSSDSHLKVKKDTGDVVDLG